MNTTRQMYIDALHEAGIPIAYLRTGNLFTCPKCGCESNLDCESNLEPSRILGIEAQVLGRGVTCDCGTYLKVMELEH